MLSRAFLVLVGLLGAASAAQAQGYEYYPRSGGVYVREPAPYVEYVVPRYRRDPVYRLDQRREEPRVYIVPGERNYYRERERAYVRPVEPRTRRDEVAPQVSRRAVPAEFQKQTVAYDGSEKPGTIVVDTRKRHLYLVQNDGTALRYGVGVGRDGFAWTGTHKVTAKREWPDWYPPAEMRQRRPDLPKMMKGGPDNPLGARALYLGSTLYRIHGSNEPWTIGQAVSSGCFRMTNEDVEDLYERVGVGAKVIVL
jgi:lipoprotein-anchoring transpeptidase ErfK/SrfK